ncbi:MAG TPA: nickel pincer cofactor biosynthesis protein LarC [Vicinamibacterales bacterium]|nr:nickel pincer cofactor biosynthesis protein LarC [Vicinamibacterales bacterium]
MSALLYLDCFAGASGDMLLGALIDAGVPIDELRRALGSLGLEEGFGIDAERVLRSGVSATKFRVRGPAAGEHPHRHLSGIEKHVRRSALSSGAQERAIALFRRLAEAEGAIHDTPIEKVQLHEVGALDSIIDIVGVVHALEFLGAPDIVASPLNVGSGTVECAHGTFPVPAPATARLLAGVPVYASGPAVEMVTPTGALLVSAYASRYGPLPQMTVDRIGYGAGDRDTKGFPNVLRVLIGQRAAADTGTAGGAAPGLAHHERVVEIRCEIDDMNPQIFGTLMDRLLEDGALDVFYAPVQMKKNRPGTLVTILCAPASRARVLDLLFRESTTIGVRWQEMERECLDRSFLTVATPLGDVRFKVARRNGAIVNATPEYDDCVRIASARGLSVKDVQARALAAWLQAGAPHAR